LLENKIKILLPLDDTFQMCTNWFVKLQISTKYSNINNHFYEKFEYLPKTTILTGFYLVVMKAFLIDSIFMFILVFSYTFQKIYSVELWLNIKYKYNNNNRR